eukprot:TRINITY_DN9246_c0_g1_i2.p1 TRINITY_DN9246_c0_g1~~TRINITY_DN9246_c0_g1_i2.p1  ORF type:complete len:195 (+),score=38.95 TRINITY_DN9246_c0_g1_i2:65-649(+)
MGSERDGQHCFRIVSEILAATVRANDSQSPPPSPSSEGNEFECCEVPAISITDYMRQIYRYGSDETWVLVLVLVDRVCKSVGRLLSSTNAHRIVLTAYLLALKLTMDSSKILSAVSRFSGVDADDLCEMEQAFLKATSWNIGVSERLFSTVAGLLCAGGLTKKRRYSGPVIPDESLERSPMSGPPGGWLKKGLR